MAFIVKFRIIVDSTNNHDGVITDLENLYKKEIFDYHKSESQGSHIFIFMKFKSKEAVEIAKTMDNIYSHSKNIKSILLINAILLGQCDSNVNSGWN